MTGTHLNGLEGTNPLAFLAALGVQVLFEHEPEQPRLWWSDDVVPHAVIDSEYTVERVADQAMKVFPRWLKSQALKPKNLPHGDVKFERDDMRQYLSIAQQVCPGDALAASLIAEGSFDEKGTVAKPSDLYFTSGTQKFLDIASKIIGEVTYHNIVNDLKGPWVYGSRFPSLKWDVYDDRKYALSAADPSNLSRNPKLTNPGAESLAILGLKYHPVYAGKNRTMTLGCSGGWKTGGSYIWPLWTRPSGPGAVKSLITHATAASPTDSTCEQYKGWGLSAVRQSYITRSDPGGYGTFGPSRVTWQAT